MSASVFDAAGFVTFDLSTGEIRSAGEEQLALIPPDVLALLDPDVQLARVITNWGGVHGERLATSLFENSTPAGVVLESCYSPLCVPPL